MVANIYKRGTRTSNPISSNAKRGRGKEGTPSTLNVDETQQQQHRQKQPFSQSRSHLTAIRLFLPLSHSLSHILSQSLSHFPLSFSILLTLNHPFFLSILHLSLSFLHVFHSHSSLSVVLSLSFSFFCLSSSLATLAFCNLYSTKARDWTAGGRAKGAKGR